jgi:hypothetical protein
MATLHEEITVSAPAERVWDAVRDVGALHTRLVPGFVTDTRMEGETRVVTFGNGAIAREPIVSIDDERRRLVWASVGGRATHYNAVMEVTADGTGCRVRWTIDLLPHELAPAISGMQRQGLATLKKTLESA